MDDHYYKLAVEMPRHDIKIDSFQIEEAGRIIEMKNVETTTSEEFDRLMSLIHR